MIIEDIKKANIEAMKAKNANLRSIYSIIINKHMLAQVEARTSGKEVTDEDTVKIIQKTIKELMEEEENYKRVNHTEEAQKIAEQRSVLEEYLPKMMGEQDIINIINTLEDKSLPSVMKHFKTNFGASVDLKLVGDVLRKQSQ